VIGPALGLEMRSLLRSPLRLLVVLVVLAVGVFVVTQGQQDVTRWQEAVDAGREAQEESLAEARGFFAAGEKGPSDRPWIDLAQPRWQDWYAATRIAREPAPLAGIAFASAESGAVTMRLSRFADPMVAQGNRIENPVLAAAGGLDLVTVLALLLPLLILALGVEVGGYERATGVLPLVRVQSGRDRSWIWARCLAVGVIAAAAGVLLTLFTVVAAGAPFGTALPLLLLVLAYVAVWTALLAFVAWRARNPSHGAVALGASWIVLCVLIPSIGVERSAALAADDFALDLTVEARDAGSELSELEQDELYAAVVARFPGLEGKVPESRRSGIRAARDGMGIVGLEERMSRRAERGAAHADLVGVMGMLSPTVAFTHALERLAGRGPEAADAFRQEVAAAAARRMELSIAASWSGQPLVEEDFEALVGAAPATVPTPESAWWVELGILVAWAAALVVVGMAPSRGRGA
jgi:ABC-2 type transport system permease protein